MPGKTRLGRAPEVAAGLVGDLVDPLLGLHQGGLGARRPLGGAPPRNGAIPMDRTARFTGVSAIR